MGLTAAVIEMAEAAEIITVTGPLALDVLRATERERMALVAGAGIATLFRIGKEPKEKARDSNLDDDLLHSWTHD